MMCYETDYCERRTYMDFALTSANSTVLTYGNEEYDVTELPPNTSLIVADMKKELLGQLSLVQTFENMKNAVDLFGVVNLAVDGVSGLHANVSGLREDFITSLGNSAQICFDLYRKTEWAPLSFIAGYNNVITGEFDAAKEAFANVSAIAEKVMNQAQKLADLFQVLADRSQEVNEKIISERSLDYEKNQKLKEKIDELQAKTKGLKEAQTSLDSEIEELQAEYLKLDKRLASAENKAFWMGIASAVASCVSCGFSAYASTTVGGAISGVSQAIVSTNNKVETSATQEGATAESKDNTQALQSSSAASTQEHLDQTNQKITDTQARITKLEEEIASIDEQLSKETDEEQKKTLLSKKEAAVKEKESEESALKSLQVSSEQDKAIINGLAASLKNASESFDKLSAEEKDVVKNLTDRIDAISSKKSALAKERRTLLSQIAENTAIIESTVVTQNELNLAIAALAAGIAAMQYIINMLNNFQKFWGSVKVFADSLQTTQLTALMSIYKNKPETFMSLPFLTQAIRNTASWVALRDVLLEYKDNYDVMHNRLNSQLNAGQAADRTESWKKAVELSKGMSHIFAVQAEQV